MGRPENEPHRPEIAPVRNVASRPLRRRCCALDLSEEIAITVLRRMLLALVAALLALPAAAADDDPLALPGAESKPAAKPKNPPSTKSRRCSAPSRRPRPR